ncbi:hypothetical protein [Kitasatospora sp. SUK 42]|uniref:hypothetical protein n=1 Tax=Kitasatospora sp. SUK 42 TaxID=1588882 RepID=UPI0018C9A0DF|nr:hypothetical protein [Kitasatospora sp. SUK 42]MBV2152957.1 hypothetical protein [Kitasatospora sp. SUK 42]
MADPHALYFKDVLTALGASADRPESFAQYCNDDGEQMLAEIFIQLDNDRAKAAGHPHGLGLFWNQVTGWLWMRGTSDGRLSNEQPLVLALVATPTSIAAAVDALLTDRATEPPLLGEDASATAYPAVEDLAAAARSTEDDDQVPLDI